MARDILELGADVVDDTIVESKHRISPKKRNYIIGLSITGVLVIGAIAFGITAANLWLQDMDYLTNIQFYYTPKDASNPNAEEPTLTLYKLDPNTTYPSTFRIPEKVQGYKVTSIAPEAFNGHNEIKKIIFTKYVNTVGEKAFYGLKNLSEISWNNSLSYIGPDAFKDTAFYNKLVEDPKGFYRIPSGVLLYLGPDYFADNTALVDSKLSIEERNNIKTKYGVSDGNIYDFDDLGVINFVSGLFQNNKKIVYIDLPSFLNDVGSKTFYNCTNLKGISFTNSQITKIGDGAFQNCTQLEDITFSDILTEVGDYAFANTAVEDIPALHNVKNMGIGIFQGCTNLETVIYPANETFTSVSEAMFKDCTSLSHIYWGDTDNSAIDYVNSFGMEAFSNTAFSEFVVPKNVTSILDMTFEDCKNLTKVSLYGNPNYLVDLDSITVDEEGHPIYESEEASGSYTLSSNNFSLKLKGDYVDASVSAIVASDGSLTFTINNLPSQYGIPSATFTLSSDEVEQLKGSSPDLYIVSEKNFYELNLSSSGKAYLLTPMNYYVADDGAYGAGTLIGVRDIRSKSFNNCDKLTTIALYGDDGNQLPGCDEGTFTFPHTLRTTHNDSYNNNTNYTFANTNATKIKLSGNVRSIGSYGFANAANLEEIEFGPSSILNSIGNYAFLNDTKLDNVSLPSKVTSLGSGVFSGCTNLTTIDLKDTQFRTVGAQLFYNCEKLAHVDLPETVTAIQSNAFNGAKSLDYVVVPKNVTQILDGAFVNTLHDDNTRLPIYFCRTLKELASVNLSDSYIDSEQAYSAVILGAEEIKKPGVAYWNGDSSNPQDILLTNLTYTGTLEKTSYVAGESFDSTGLSFTAEYSDSNPITIDGLKDILWEKLESGMTSVNGTYVVGDVTLTVTISGITVE